MLFTAAEVSFSKRTGSRAESTTSAIDCNEIVEEMVGVVRWWFTGDSLIQSYLQFVNVFNYCKAITKLWNFVQK
ncbi:hypothetical protein HanIR_Chr13g0662841 [Helianthus annuus]|nr:hypothetical protein HanIR_Chr13g0662841 [Helianthus annuus]